jgi:NitT/TauT family transport system substrate-binding protein
VSRASNKSIPSSGAKYSRRHMLKLGGALAGTLAIPGLARAAGPKIRVGYLPLSAGLPFYAAVEKGYFKEAGLDVEPIRFSSAQQIMEAMLAGRLEGCANGTGTATLAIGNIAEKGVFRLFCTNPSNKDHVLEEILVAKASPYKTLADLKGKKIACGPGIQNTTLCKGIFEGAGAPGVKPVEIPYEQHVAAIAAGQIDACYALEPMGTLGRINGSTRVLEAAVVSHYVLGDPAAPWHGGAAALGSAFVKANPQVAKQFIAAYLHGVDLVRHSLDEALVYLNGYTPIPADLAKQVPMASYASYTEFSADDVRYYQKFYDFFSQKGVFPEKVDVASMLYKG